MIGSTKNSREIFSRKCIWTQEKEIQAKFNSGLSANRLSNNWTLNIMGNFLAKFGWFLLQHIRIKRVTPFFQRSDLYFLENLKKDSAKCLKKFPRYIRKVNV